MLFNRLLGGSRTPGDTALYSCVRDPWYHQPPYDMRTFTISTLSASSIWANLRQANVMSGNGAGDITMFYCAGIGSTYSDQYGFMSYITNTEYGSFGSIGESVVTHPGASGTTSDWHGARGNAASNGSGDLAAFGTYTKIQYYSITSTNSATVPESVSSPYTNQSLTSNGISDRGLFGGANSVLGYFTFSTRSAAQAFGDDPYAYPTAGILSNDIFNRAVWTNGVCGEGCSVNYIRYANMISLGSAASFGTNTFSTWSPMCVSNGINNLGIFFGGPYTNQSYSGAWKSYINISTPSNATAAADIETPTAGGGASSNSRL